MDRISATTEQAEFLLSIIDSRAGGWVSSRRVALAAMIEDSAALVKVAQAHGVLPLLFFRFPEWPALADAQLAAHIREECVANTTRNLALAAELLTLLQEFDRVGIQALPFKGVLLAVALYGNLQLRPAGDLDILIHFGDVQRATVLLQSRGYVLLTPLRPGGEPVEEGAGEYQFQQKGGAGIMVELRWRLTPGHFRRDLGMDVLWPGRRTTELQGRSVPDLAPEETLVLLCMHGTKHEWLRLFWICDIAQLLHRYPDLDWRRVERTARYYGLFRPLVTGVLLSYSMAGAPVPEPVRQRFAKNRSARRLEEHIRKHFFDSASRPFDGLPLQIESLGFGDRLARVRKAALEPPGMRDRASVRLPSSLDFVYYVVRPARLIWKYLIRGVLRKSQPMS